MGRILPIDIQEYRRLLAVEAAARNFRNLWDDMISYNDERPPMAQIRCENDEVKTMFLSGIRELRMVCDVPSIFADNTGKRKLV